MGGPWQDAQRGIFQASHVEVKLAAHAVHVLLRLFSLPATAATTTTDEGGRPTGEDDGHAIVTRRRLMALRRARWSDGSRPAFDIVFSHKSCVTCRLFVSRLSRLTGIEMRLIWGQRLVPAVYAQGKGRKAKSPGDPSMPRSGDGLDWEDEMDVDDEDYEDENGEDDVETNGQVIDLTNDPDPDTSAPAPAPSTTLIKDEKDSNGQALNTVA
ncbi:hypothetical protein HRG_008993 [Hirsutella rhossiliensis]|uniref:Uncharacterized protein n=1 Tax=Hirsutella rhossiliensis TaxID=111463 RepID=A0A9P8MRA2_9HYPO|nr:uncharacterized protein HRG_08993 [Hirsutella rhossiliensis]KAH0959972.1 hypothetical protein HRG_08993 [Hirsutella rhossiliensis]